MTDAQALEAARKLVRKYCHPSRLGRVPNEKLREAMGVTDTMLAFMAQQAREQETLTPPPSSRAGGGHLADIEPAEPERTGSPRSVERDLYGEPPGEERRPRPEEANRWPRAQPGYHGEGEAMSEPDWPASDFAGDRPRPARFRHGRFSELDTGDAEDIATRPPYIQEAGAGYQAGPHDLGIKGRQPGSPEDEHDELQQEGP